MLHFPQSSVADLDHGNRDETALQHLIDVFARF